MAVYFFAGRSTLCYAEASKILEKEEGVNMRWLVLCVVFCSSFAGCGPKHGRVSSGQLSPQTEVVVTFSVSTGDGTVTSKVRALVDPWQLEVGQGWHCSSDTDLGPYQFVAVVARAEGPHLAVGAVLLVKGQKVSSFGGSLLINEPGNNMMKLAFPSAPAISFEVVKEGEANELREEMKKKELEFLDCTKQDQILKRE